MKGLNEWMNEFKWRRDFFLLKICDFGKVVSGFREYGLLSKCRFLGLEL